MRRSIQFCLMTALTIPAAAQAEWQAIEQVTPYAITGKSGAELYTSIGENGPRAGIGRVIAHTTFKLTWTRKYEPQADMSCRLTVARPKLIITYTLPRPTTQLPPATKASWDSFITGVETHERWHGETIKQMVKAIEAYSLGLTAADDPECSKIRLVLTKRLGELSGYQRQQGRDFDKVEMGEGGNIKQLILKLVNGP
ncbi:putative secreted Zn-dependent protease [Rhizobium azibense]|uniref:Putative secreted Zn-dependent protease n=2 Tax=Rhizobium azibense TaxID=1136135 RepID=A0A4R3QWA9_9HYPH|nr:putative secreted Zn-dependent protease [Rhizobium azibense]